MPSFASVGDGQPLGTRLSGAATCPAAHWQCPCFPSSPPHWLLLPRGSCLDTVPVEQDRCVCGCPTAHQLLSRHRCSHGVPCVPVTWKEAIAGSSPQTCTTPRVTRQVCTFTPCSVPAYTAVVHPELTEPQQTFQGSVFLLNSH